MKLLQKFYSDFQTREEVKQYLLHTLREQAADRAMLGEDTKGYKEAKDCINHAFRDLDNQFKEKKKKIPQSNR